MQKPHADPPQNVFVRPCTEEVDAKAPDTMKNYLTEMMLMKNQRQKQHDNSDFDQINAMSGQLDFFGDRQRSIRENDFISRLRSATAT